MTGSSSQEPMSVRIDRDVHERVKAAAWWSRRTKGSIVEEALREYLDGITEQPIPNGGGLNRGRRPRLDE